MSNQPDIYGSEEGWRAASFDSRRAQKNKDIKALIDRQIVNQKKIEDAHNDAFYNDLIEAAGPVVYAGLDKKGHAVGGDRNSRYRNNFDKWIESLGDRQ
jgi:hypothetical protein